MAASKSPDANTTLTVRVLLALMVYLAFVGTYAQMHGIRYTEPWWLVSIIAPGLLAVIYNTYKSGDSKSHKRLWLIAYNAEFSEKVRILLSAYATNVDNEMLNLPDCVEARDILIEIDSQSLPNIIILDGRTQCTNRLVPILLSLKYEPVIPPRIVLCDEEDDSPGDDHGISCWMRHEYFERIKKQLSLPGVVAEPKKFLEKGLDLILGIFDVLKTKI